MKTYRAVLVGTGSISEAHVRAVEATQGRVTLEAAVDIDADRVTVSGLPDLPPGKVAAGMDVIIRVRRAAP